MLAYFFPVICRKLSQVLSLIANLIQVHRKVAMEGNCPDMAENALAASVSSLNLNKGECTAMNQVPTNTMKKVDLPSKKTKSDQERKKTEVVRKKAEEEQKDGAGPAGDNKENHGRHKGGGSSGGSKGSKGQSKQAGAGGGKSECGAGGRGKSVFTFVRFLTEHPNRITFQARMTGEDWCKAGQLAAIKAYDTEEARDAEVARYKRLQGLGGLPQVLRERLGLVWSEAEEGRVHALVLSWVGPDDAGGERFSGARAAAALPARALAQVRATLVAMHGRGVAHGDVREDNVVWDAAAGQAYVVDLSHAATEGDAGAGFAAECCEDLCRAERLFAEAQAREGLAARFLR